MPDSPDYSKYLPNSNRFSLQDMGELAVRLGAPSVQDRRGEVVFYDTFDHGLGGWELLGSGTGNSLVITTANQHNRPYSALLTAGSDGSKLAAFRRYIPVQDTKKIGLEFGLRFLSTFGLFSIDFTITVNGRAYSAYFRYNGTTGKIDLLDGSGTWVTILTVDTVSYGHVCCLPVKYVVDLEHTRYYRLMVGGVEYSLTNRSVYNVPASSQNLFYMRFDFIGTAGINSQMQVYYVILTGNEP